MRKCINLKSRVVEQPNAVHLMSQGEYDKRKQATIDGLKYIAEQYNTPKSSSQKVDLATQIEELKKMGCLDHSVSEIGHMRDFELSRGVSKQGVSCGESFIRIYADVNTPRLAAEYDFMYDDDYSAYANLRSLTGDSKYTKDYFVGLAKDKDMNARANAVETDIKPNNEFADKSSDASHHTTVHKDSSYKDSSSRGHEFEMDVSDNSPECSVSIAY